MMTKIAFACLAILAALCVTASAPAAPSGRERVVRLPGLIEFENPDTKNWQWTSGINCPTCVPRPVAQLVDMGRKAVIRMHLMDAEERPVRKVIRSFVELMETDGFKYTVTNIGRGDEAQVSVAWSDGKPDGLSGKITVMLLRGNPKMTLAVQGIWYSRDNAAMTKDFDAAARSVKWCPPEQ